MNAERPWSLVHRLARPVSLVAVLLLRLLLGVETAKAQGTIENLSVPDLPPPTLPFELSGEFGVGPGTSATGGIQVALGDGSVRFVYESVAGTTWRSSSGGHQCLVFFLGGLPSGGLDPTDTAIAIFREDLARPGVIEVELTSQQIFPGPLFFEVSGRFDATASDAPRRASPLWFLTRDAPQRVSIEGTDVEAGFSSSVRVRHDHGASGFVALELPDGDPPILFEPIFGTSVPGAGTGPGYIVILLALKGAPLRMDNLVTATVRPDPLLPSGDVWDLWFVRDADASAGAGLSGLDQDWVADGYAARKASVTIYPSRSAFQIISAGRDK